MAVFIPTINFEACEEQDEQDDTSLDVATRIAANRQNGLRGGGTVKAECF